MATTPPNVEGTSNPAVLTGGVFGAVVGEKVSETVGFYGNVGQVQAAFVAAPTLTGTYATDYVALQAWVTAVQAVLVGTGITASS